MKTLPINIITAKPTPKSSRSDSRPTIIKWKDAKIIRSHSITPLIESILQVSKALDVVKVGIVGEPASGKGTFAEALAHLLHITSAKQHYVRWAFRRFTSDDFLELEETLDSLPVANYILHFEDLSFLSDHKRLAEVKRVVTKIRHRKVDVKIILLYDYHYTLALDKYLRQSNFKIFTSLGSSERQNMEEQIGRRQRSRIDTFARKWHEETIAHKFTFKLKHNKEPFVYQYKNPFILVAAWDGATLRFCVSPTRQWLEPHCTVCSEGTRQGKVTLDAEELYSAAVSRFGITRLKQAWNILEAQFGVITTGQQAANCYYFLQKIIASQVVDREHMRQLLDLTPKLPTSTPRLSTDLKPEETSQTPSKQESET